MKFRSLFCITLIFSGLIGCATALPQACNSNSGSSYINSFNGNLDSSKATQNNCSAVKSSVVASNANAETESVCSFKKGLFAGEHGMYPDGLCQESDWDEYATGFTMGRKIYEASSRLEIISEALETSRKRLWILESSDDGIGQPAEVSRVKANIVALIQVRDLESRRLHNLHADNTH